MTSLQYKSKHKISLISLTPKVILLYTLFSILTQSAFASQSGSKKNICTVTINSPDEKQVFQSKLSRQDFNFIELTDYSSGKGNRNNDWFQNACEQKVQCDVLIISGHFGGNFFGDSGFSLGLNELEQNSCQSRCSGILEKPKEVYLFGCNTLSSKEQDHRTPEDYYRALVEHDIDPIEAERIVAARYSPLGFSNKERMQRIFEGVPLIYGFSSVGPSGKHVKSSLARYLEQIGDYKKHLQALEDGRRDNSIFLNSMTAYTTAIASGMSSNNLNYEVKQNSCKMSDTSIPLKDRVGHAGDILASSPYIYFPSVAEFIKNNFSTNALYAEDDTHIRNNLIRITARTDLKDQIMKIAEAGGFGPSLQMDLLNFSRTVRWLTQDEYDVKTRHLFTSLMEKPTLENADVFCSIQSEYSDSLENIEFTRRDLPQNFNFNSPHAIKMLGCLKVQDETITSMTFQAVQRMNLTQLSVESKFGVYQALVELPGLSTEIVDFLLKQPPHRGRQETDAQAFMKYLIIRKIEGPQQLELLKQYWREITTDDHRSFLFWGLTSNKNLTVESETYYINLKFQLCQKDEDDCYMFFSGRDIVQNWIARYIPLESSPTFLQNLSHVIHTNEIKLTPDFVSALIRAFQRSNRPTELDSNIPSLLASVTLKPDQLEAVLKLYRDLDPKSSNGFINSIRHILYLNKGKIPDITPQELEGPKVNYKCTRLGGSRHSCTTQSYN